MPKVMLAWPKSETECLRPWAVRKLKDPHNTKWLKHRCTLPKGHAGECVCECGAMTRVQGAIK